MPVQPDQIAIANRELSDNAEVAAEVANEVGISYYQLCALLEKESNGRNVYGNDAGGTFSGFRDPVSECNWKGFRHEVIVRGRTSNGVGPCQLTYKGFFVEMESQGMRPWLPRDNIEYGARLYWSYFLTSRADGWSVKSSIRRSGTKYNTGEFGFIGYGDRLYELAMKWLKLVGTADVET